MIDTKSMLIQEQTTPTITAALTLLKSYSCLEPKIVESEAEKKHLGEALKLIISLTDWENLGICADNSEQGFTALTSYLKALGYNSNFDSSSMTSESTPVYLKFNTQKMSCYLDGYTGTYRGVLVACQSEDETLAGIYGYFPLDLFT